MKRTGAFLLLLCALPAHGDHVPVSQSMKLTLSTIETFPTKESIERVFSDPVPQLRDVALNAAADFGVRLRATRSLPLFCPTTANCSATSAHQAILDVIASIPPETNSGRNLLLLLAGLEALGITRTGDEADVSLLTPRLSHSSRDVRATAALALGRLCNTQALTPLRSRYQVEQVPQVQAAISAALRALDACAL